MKRVTLKQTILYLIIFYLVGVAGFIIPFTNKIFSNLTPLAILLSLSILVIYHCHDKGIKTIGIFIFILSFSFLAEVVGVKTGIIFGSYTYGRGLGPRIFETPLLIGFNWLMLVYCTKVMTDKLSDNDAIRCIISSLLMVGYDLVMEYCAPALEMWYWQDDKIPLGNFITWFLLSLFFHIIIRISKISFFNKMAAPVFIIQFLFFVILLVYFSISTA